ncbi:MAG: hypothetical protein ABI883_02155 [Chthoniobacterales bacterium]
MGLSPNSANAAQLGQSWLALRVPLRCAKRVFDFGQAASRPREIEDGFGVAGIDTQERIVPAPVTSRDVETHEAGDAARG